jgi:hypothetical protein
MQARLVRGGRAAALLVSLWWMGAGVQAAPPLTTVQDVLYKADGSPFNGFLLIDWRSFEATDSSNIATQSLTVPIVNGVVRVQLVPTTNAVSGSASYRVRYNSDGRIQLEETWAVPPSTMPLRLKDVRTASPGQGTITPPPATEIQQADVVGLVNDLAIRPVKGAGYSPSRAVYVDPSGALESVIGNLSDCVRVDGTAGPCGTGSAGGGPVFVDVEQPMGLINGSNAAFTLSNLPEPPTSIRVYRNGLLQQPDADYTLIGNTITFLGGSIPQIGDTLSAAYRLGSSSAPEGMAGGALSGNYPNPSLALGVISDVNIAEVAGIRESKLALDYPTHSSANDPTAEQKAALSGTAGAPSASNKYVTDQDARLTDARLPAAHGLLSGSHSDAVAGGPVRGDLVVAQGTAPTAWTRLPVGPANRCLTSNGFDVVWNTCLYTGFTSGAMPFTDSYGNLAQNATRLVWDNINRKLSVGNNVGATTLYLYDATSGTGATSLTVRAGEGQSTDPLQRWLDASGGEFGRVEADGRFIAPSFRAGSSASRAGWRDTGTSADPAIRADGDAWYNTQGQSRRTVEGGQVHALPQVICGSTGLSTSSTSPTRLGSCTIPAGLLRVGDRVEVRFDYWHAGTATGFWFEVRWGGTTLAARNAGAADSGATGRAEAGVHGSGAQWSAQSWGSALAFAAAMGNATDPVSSPIVVDFLGRMAGATAETVELRNFTVLRYPAQQNP